MKMERKNKQMKKNVERYRWLLPENIRDNQHRRPDDPNYDPTTLYIPESEFNQMTPFEKQYWRVKRKNWDSIVFFKKGKFYELYERDADFGVTELHLKLSDRVNMRMVGVPEDSFAYWASLVLGLGQRVVKADQLETLASCEKRKRDINERKDAQIDREDKIIRRGVTAIYTAGTLVEEELLPDHNATYLLAFVENPSAAQYGVCFLDAATCEIYIGHFVDDEARTQFETLLLQIQPKEIILERVS